MKKTALGIMLLMTATLVFSQSENVLRVFDLNNTAQKSYLVSKIDSITHSIEKHFQIHLGEEKHLYSIDDTEFISLENDDEIVSIAGRISLGNSTAAHSYLGCKVVTIADEIELSDNVFFIKCNKNSCAQTFIVEDEEDKVYLMARIPVENGQDVEINALTTALALVTMNPLFSPLDAEVYDDMVQLISSSSRFPKLLDEVEKLICNKEDILNENNTDMILALANLLEDLFSEGYEITAPVFHNPISKTLLCPSKASYTPDIYPLSASIYGNKLILRNTNLTPSYYGTVEKSDGSISDIRVLTSSDWGWWEWITQNQMRYGSETEFYFTQDGEYHFNLSRVNEAATIDFYMRIGACVLSTIGLPTSGDRTFANFIVNRITSTIGFLPNTIDNNSAWSTTSSILSLVTGAVCDYLQMEVSRDLMKKGWWENAQKIGKVVGRTLFIYNIIKGSSNILDRIAYAFNSPQEINFCLCYYGGDVTACTTAKLIKAGGDEQSGYADQKLLLPLKVYVQTLGTDGIYYPSSSYHRVKFEVVSGGGHVTHELVSASDGNVATTEWYLGEGGDQIVKATVVDIITNQEISEPEYFTAELKGNADLTIRLDWNKLSGNTDIDLHVTDPYGEEIYWAHTTSNSGGWLDWDDVVGPGPEHISWTNAPSGAYLIQVHYYGSDTGEITSYKVTINALGTIYGPYTGTISKYQLITIGVLNLPSGSFTQAPAINGSSPTFIEKNIIEENVIGPAKPVWVK